MFARRKGFPLHTAKQVPGHSSVFPRLLLWLPSPAFPRVGKEVRCAFPQMRMPFRLREGHSHGNRSPEG